MGYTYFDNIFIDSTRVDAITNTYIDFIAPDIMYIVNTYITYLPLVHLYSIDNFVMVLMENIRKVLNIRM